MCLLSLDSSMSGILNSLLQNSSRTLQQHNKHTVLIAALGGNPVVLATVAKPDKTNGIYTSTAYG